MALVGLNAPGKHSLVSNITERTCAAWAQEMVHAGAGKGALKPTNATSPRGVPSNLRVRNMNVGMPRPSLVTAAFARTRESSFLNHRPCVDTCTNQMQPPLHPLEYCLSTMCRSLSSFHTLPLHDCPPHPRSLHPSPACFHRSCILPRRKAGSRQWKQVTAGSVLVQRLGGSGIWGSSDMSDVALCNDSGFLGAGARRGQSISACLGAIAQPCWQNEGGVLC